MKNKFIWIIALIIIIIGASAAFLVNSNWRSTVKAKEPAVKEFKINAFKYDYDPNVITVKNGDKVKITINNADVLHGIKIPELEVSGNEVVEFTADKNGEFVWYCNNYCGDGHGQMQGRLIVQ